MRTTICLLLLVLFGLAPVSAAGSQSCGRWQVSVEALYWKPYDVTYFVGQEVTQEAIPEAEPKADAEATSEATEEEKKPKDPPPVRIDARWVVTQPNYNWGVRVRGHYLLPRSCVYLAAEYLYHNNTGVADASTKDGDFASKAQFDHHAADVAIGNYFITGRCVWASLFAGARYVYLRSRLSADIASPLGEGGGTRSTWLSAAGPLIGLEGHYCLGLLDLSAQFTAAATAGRRNAETRIDLRSSPNAGILSTIERRSTTLVPSFGGELAAALCWQGSGTWFHFRAGFAFRRYVQALDPESNSGGCLQGVNVAGPFAGLGVCF